ncbi:MAG: hypothetical protein OES12_02680, partial [Anaerolineae bacterium]|nr:hypothetical protein [Anaerolineae bacterium]
MKIPPSNHFTPISLQESFNLVRQNLPQDLQGSEDIEAASGLQSYRGIPFDLGRPDQPNVILLAEDEVDIDVDEIRATFVLFLHAVEDRVPEFQEGLRDFEGNIPMAGDMVGNELGQPVSDYSLVYTDGTTASRPILRRFAIQQRHVSWGASPFAAVHAHKPAIYPTATEEQILGRIPQRPYGAGELRTRSARDLRQSHLWLYALPNPNPEKPIHRIVCTPRAERSVIYAISYTNLKDHPLRPGIRQKLRLKLPPEHRLNALDETENIAIDLGTVISARSALIYDRERWSGSEPDVQPILAEDEVIVEYESHAQAKLYVATASDTSNAEQPFVEYDLRQDYPEVMASVSPANRPVKLRVVERGSSQPVAVRLHLHGEAGEYLPPRGHHRKVNPHWFEDNYAEFVNNFNQYCYIPGECVVDLPVGELFVEINRGYEVTPLRSSFQVTPETDEITFELDRVLSWREQGWVTADTHIHFLSPQTALLEGTAE